MSAIREPIHAESSSFKPPAYPSEQRQCSVPFRWFSGSWGSCLGIRAFCCSRATSRLVSDPPPPNDHTLFQQPLPLAETGIALSQSRSTTGQVNKEKNMGRKDRKEGFW